MPGIYERKRSGTTRKNREEKSEGIRVRLGRVRAREERGSVTSLPASRVGPTRQRERGKVGSWAVCCARARKERYGLGPVS